MWPDLYCQIHPDKAAQLGIEDGERVLGHLHLVVGLGRPRPVGATVSTRVVADHAVVAGFMALIPVVVPSVFMGLGLFVSFMQAFVFTILSMIYISGAVAHSEEH